MFQTMRDARGLTYACRIKETMSFRVRSGQEYKIFMYSVLMIVFLYIFQKIFTEVSTLKIGRGKLFYYQCFAGGGASVKGITIP